MRRLKKSCQRGTAWLLTGTLLGVWPLSTWAAVPNTPKEEVIYINLDADGSVQDINAVNIFELSAAGQIVDYGRYQELRNMTTTDPLEYADDTVTIDAQEGKLYYEGKLVDHTMPWKIRIRYYLDGKEYSAQEIAGMSGALRMTVDVTEDPAYQGDFFQEYALQASLNLDTEKCDNIVAPDATIANVGSEKQLTYMILPGRGIHTEITADVTEFSLAGISFNGVLLNLDVEVDDDELMDQVTELLAAIEQLDDGAGELNDGVSEMQSEVQGELQSGVEELYGGSASLQSGAGALQSGGSSLQNGAASLQSGAADLDKGVRSLHKGIKQIGKALDALNSQSGTLKDGSAAIRSALAQIQEALSKVAVTTEDLTALTEASSQVKAGISTLALGASSLQESANFAAYKAVMAQNGVDIDGLLAGNTNAISAVNDLITQADAAEKLLVSAGIPAEAIDPWKNQCVALGNQLVTLLQGNNGAIAGMESYLDGISQGVSQLVFGAQSLQANYELFDASILELVQTLETLAGKMSALSGAINTLVAEYGKLDQGISDYTDGVAQIVAGYSQISAGASQLVQGGAALKSGSGRLYSGTGELLSGIVEIYNGTGTLRDGTGALKDGVAELLTGVAQLYEGSDELKDGTKTMREETSGMDEKITDQIDELLETVNGGKKKISSFVSAQNTNVKSVQFVIQTAGVSQQEAEPPAVRDEPQPTVWQKFLNLFGLSQES